MKMYDLNLKPLHCDHTFLTNVLIRDVTIGGVFLFCWSDSESLQGRIWRSSELAASATAKYEQVEGHVVHAWHMECAHEPALVQANNSTAVQKTLKTCRGRKQPGSASIHLLKRVINGSVYMVLHSIKRPV